MRKLSRSDTDPTNLRPTCGIFCLRQPILVSFFVVYKKKHTQKVVEVLSRGSTTFRKFVELRTQVRQVFVVGPGSITSTFALIGALSLYSIDNVKGTSAYLSLSTWKLVHRYRGTGLPMTENVIETII